MNCKCHGEPMIWEERRDRQNGVWRCVVQRRERQARYARRRRANSVEYVVTQRRGRLKRERSAALAQLSQLIEEGGLGS